MDDVGGLDALNTVLFRGQALRVLVGTTENLERKVRLEVYKFDTLRQEQVQCAVGVGGLFGVGTANDWCTLGYRRNIGDDGIAGCRLARGIF